MFDLFVTVDVSVSKNGLQRYEFYISKKKFFGKHYFARRC
jgi:hypothetical protein